MSKTDMNYERGERIAKLRRKQNMSQDELADYAQLSRQAMSKIENGGDFKVSNLMNLVSALGVSPMQILYDDIDDKESIIDDIYGELVDMDKCALRMILGAIRGAKEINEKK